LVPGESAHPLGAPQNRLVDADLQILSELPLLSRVHREEPFAKLVVALAIGLHGVVAVDARCAQFRVAAKHLGPKIVGRPREEPGWIQALDGSSRSVRVNRRDHQTGTV
jgi:hypothetical protein